MTDDAFAQALGQQDAAIASMLDGAGLEPIAGCAVLFE